MKPYRQETSSIRNYLFGQGKKRHLKGGAATLTKGVALATSIFVVWSVFSHPQALVQRGVTLGLFMALSFLLYSTPGIGASEKIPWYDWILAGATISVSLHIILNTERLITRISFFDPVTLGDLFFGSLLMLLLIEATRRVIGPWLSALSILSIIYIFLGHLIPGRFGHTGFSYQHLIDEMFLTTEGIWGSTLGVASTQVIVFVIFGAFLLHSGAANFIFDLASVVAGWRTGGLAKVAVITSGLFGMISGSPVANVSSMGAITIPMMRKSGYPGDFAAAVECCASVGGILMPPVMGSVAFIMADVIGVPYGKVALAAFLPAVIYYLAIYFSVDFRARRMGLQGLERKEMDPVSVMLKKGMVFFFPIIFMVFRMMTSGVNPARVGIEAVVLVFLCSLFSRENRMNPTKVLNALISGSFNGIMIVVTMACCGIIIGAINLTGLGAKFSSYLMALSHSSVLATLFTVMLLALLLGLAMNISTSYLLTAVVAGPVIVSMGVPIIAAHMFILFYAAMAAMTPPVAVAAFVAASMADAPPMRVGFLAMRITLVAYFLPFVFVFSPALLLEGSWFKITLAFVFGVFAVILMTMGSEGWWLKREMPGKYRVPMIIAGVLVLTGQIYLVLPAVVLAVLMLVLGYGGFDRKSVRTEAQ